MFGTIPAKGFYIRHASGITLNGVNFHYHNSDERPLMVTDDADNVEYRYITVDGKKY